MGNDKSKREGSCTLQPVGMGTAADEQAGTAEIPNESSGKTSAQTSEKIGCEVPRSDPRPSAMGEKRSLATRKMIPSPIGERSEKIVLRWERRDVSRNAS